ncbi:hypothetical protein Rs2_29042 [Raphanus sativus]|nr:hypothetical protein Rs2_29042 [Raphanus sativus]
MQIYPQARHCACLMHLQRNVQTIFKKKHLLYLISRAARAYRIEDFCIHFNKIMVVDIACADYLIRIGLEHWARSHFPGARYNIMTSNLTESLNSALASAIEFLIVALVEYIRTMLMGWFSSRRAAANSTVTPLTPRVSANLARSFSVSTGYGIHCSQTVPAVVGDEGGTLPLHKDKGNRKFGDDRGGPVHDDFEFGEDGTSFTGIGSNTGTLAILRASCAGLSTRIGATTGVGPSEMGDNVVRNLIMEFEMPTEEILPVMGRGTPLVGDDDDCQILEGTDMTASNHLRVGQVFPSKEDLKMHLTLYAISNKFRFLVKKSEPGKMLLECVGTICGWRVYATKIGGCSRFEI